MSKNVTLRMDEKLLRQVRHKAVDAHMSLSAWVVETLKKLQSRKKAGIVYENRRLKDCLKEELSVGHLFPEMISMTADLFIDEGISKYNLKLARYSYVNPCA